MNPPTRLNDTQWGCGAVNIPGRFGTAPSRSRLGNFARLPRRPLAPRDAEQTQLLFPQWEDWAIDLMRGEEENRGFRLAPPCHGQDLEARRCGMRVAGTEERDYVCGRLFTEVWEITAQEWRDWRASSAPQ